MGGFGGALIFCVFCFWTVHPNIFRQTSRSAWLWVVLFFLISWLYMKQEWSWALTHVFEYLQHGVILINWRKKSCSCLEDFTQVFCALHSMKHYFLCSLIVFAATKKERRGLKDDDVMTVSCIYGQITAKMLYKWTVACDSNLELRHEVEYDAS